MTPAERAAVRASVDPKREKIRLALNAAIEAKGTATLCAAGFVGYEMGMATADATIARLEAERVRLVGALREMVKYTTETWVAGPPGTPPPGLVKLAADDPYAGCNICCEHGGKHKDCPVPEARTALDGVGDSLTLTERANVEFARALAVSPACPCWSCAHLGMFTGAFDRLAPAPDVKGETDA